MKAIENIQDYHQRTKHYPDRYARSLGYMDWKNQPNPFRFYEGAKRLNLPLLSNPIEHPFHVLLEPQSIPPNPFDLQAIAAFLELSLGLSAWKQYGASEWSLRMNPSSGNLHPTECYLLLPCMGEIPACIAHYNPLLHGLDIRYEFDEEAAEALDLLNGFGVVLSSIYWREAWKYGERAYRYTQHDVGHALGALRFSAALQGWTLGVRPEVSDGSLNHLLGFHDDRQVPGEMERADCFCWVSTSDSTVSGVSEWLTGLHKPDYTDRPNRLSPAVVDWPVIEEAASICESPGYRCHAQETGRAYPANRTGHRAEAIIRQRRSAQAFDPASSRIDFASFKEILMATLSTGDVPFDVLTTSTNIHLFLFVHRIEGLKPGLYCLIRHDHDLDALRAACSDNFLWQQVEQGMPLYLLQPGDYTGMAESISCHQSIAGDSTFSLAMLASFDSLLSNAPWRYPSLFWEAGLIGQALYLQAEDKGFRGTGIGCYFDDVMHQQLGLTDNAWQDLYHFTIGSPIVDERLQTKPAYHHLSELRGGQDE